MSKLKRLSLFQWIPWQDSPPTDDPGTRLPPGTYFSFVIVFRCDDHVARKVVFLCYQSTPLIHSGSFGLSGSTTLDAPCAQGPTQANSLLVIDFHIEGPGELNSLHSVKYTNMPTCQYQDWLGFAAIFHWQLRMLSLGRIPQLQVDHVVFFLGSKKSADPCD